MFVKNGCFCLGKAQVIFTLRSLTSQEAKRPTPGFLTSLRLKQTPCQGSSERANRVSTQHSCVMKIRMAKTAAPLSLINSPVLSAHIISCGPMNPRHQHPWNELSGEPAGATISESPSNPAQPRPSCHCPSPGQTTLFPPSL